MTIENLILSLPEMNGKHAPGSEFYKEIKQSVREEVEVLFSRKEGNILFNPFGEIQFPYRKMGNLDSLNLFDLDELIIFSFYWVNRTKYRKVLDLGANLGLHSMIMSRCGYSVSCYEPDPIHFGIIKENFSLNGIDNVEMCNAAISNQAGEMEFIRVLGNTMSSHITGAKSNPYGELEMFPVEVVAFKELLEGIDLVKMDIEGKEKDVLTNTERNDWVKMDALVEIENANNAEAVFIHFNKIGINLFSQKINWKRVKTIEEMPTSYHEGTLFISSKEMMPWG